MALEAVFLDRDGTINFDYGYVGDPAKIKILPGVIEGLTELKRNFPDVKFIVISNQAGVARGIITMEQVKAVNGKIAEILGKANIRIERFYICPFHPDFSSPEETSCRKPSPEMLLQASRDFNIELRNAYFIGDTKKDVESGKAANCKTVLLASEVYPDELKLLEKENNLPDFFARDFFEAVDFIVKSEMLKEENAETK